MKIICALIILSFMSAIASADTDLENMQREYLEVCGGKVYSKCDDGPSHGGRSQRKIFDQAVALARSTNRRVLAIIGADWCPPCVYINRKLKYEPGFRARLERLSVVVELNAELASTRSLAQLGEHFSIPSYIFLNPATGEPQRVNPLSLTWDELTQVLAGERDANVRRSQDRLQNVRMAVLLKPLDRPQARFGTSQLVVSTRLSGLDRDQLQDRLRQSFDLLQGFDWLNSARAASAALAVEEENPVALTLLALATMQIDPESEFVHETFKRADRATRDFPLDDSDRSFVTAMFQEYCVTFQSGCGNPSLRQLKPGKVLQRVCKHGNIVKPDYLVFLAWKIRDRLGLLHLRDQFPAYSAPYHYLTHVYENAGDVASALDSARAYASMAPDIPHALHMYAHVLPESGQWLAGVEFFKKAHQLHLDEMKNEGVLPAENWHFAHNLDLLSAALVRLGRPKEALQLWRESGLDADSLYEFKKLTLELIVGEYDAALARADDFLRSNFISLGFQLRRVEALLGLGRIEEAKDAFSRIVAMNLPGSEKPTLVDAGARILLGGLNDSTHGTLERWSYRAFAVLGLGFSAQFSHAQGLQQLASQLQMPGFDAWSSSTLEQALVVRLLNDLGQGRLAKEIAELPTAANRPSLIDFYLCSPGTEGRR